MARPIPVLPLVGSTMVEPGRSTPRRSASSTMDRAMRSFTLPAGLSDSILATTAAPPARGRRRRRTIGVPPIRSSTESAIGLRMFLTDLGCRHQRRHLDVVHGARAAPTIGGARGQLREREAIDHRGDGLGDLLPELGQLGLAVTG